MKPNDPLTQYSVTVRFADDSGHFEPDVLAKSPRNAALIALWRLRREFRQRTVALIVSAPDVGQPFFPVYEGQSLTFARHDGQPTLSPPEAMAMASASRLVAAA